MCAVYSNRRRLATSFNAIQERPMKTSVKTSVGVITGALLIGAACAASAETPSDDAAPAVQVSYSDLDLNTVVGAKTLYHRIAVAATHVCPDPGERTLDALAKTSACRRGAVDRAVHDVSNPQLAAVYASAGRRG
jgi:UrcA family protein